MMKLHAKVNIKVLSIIILMMCAYSIFAYFVPPAIDDFAFMRYYINANGGSDLFSFSALVDYIVTVRQLENGRLANYLCAPVLFWLPHWLWALILGGIITTCITMTSWFSSGCNKPSGRLIIFIWTLIVMFLPWNDFSGLMVADYALNYLFALLLVLVTFCSLLCAECSKMRLRLYFPAIICAFFAGMTHETVSLCLITTLGIIAVCKHFRLGRQWWGLFVAIIIGEIFCLTAPGILSRISTTSSHFEIPTLYLLARHAYLTILLFSLCFIIAMIMFLTKNGRSRLKKIFTSQVNIYMGLFALIVSISVIALQAPMRFSLFSSVPTIIVVANGLLTQTNFFKYFTQIVSCAFLAGILLFYGIIIYWQKKIYEENEIIIEAVEAANNKPVYYDIIRNAPWYTFSYAVDGLWYLGAQQYWVAQYYKRLPDIAIVLPKAVEHFDISRAAPLTYPNHSGYFQNDDYLIAEGKLDINTLPSQLRYKMNGGKERGSATTWRIFFDDLGNKWYIGVPLRGRIHGPYDSVYDAR